MRPHRTAAEKTTLGICAAILAVVVGLILAQLPGDDAAPAPTATVDQIETAADQFHVTVSVANSGGATAANLQVNAELVVDGQTTEADQTIDFLAPGDEARLVFVFADDPRSGELTVEVGAFTVP